MYARNLALLAAGAGLVLGAAACGDDAAPVAGATTTPTATAAVPAVSSAPTGPPGAAACPAAEADLLKAVNKKTGGTGAATKLDDIVCYQSYAIGTRPGTVADDEPAVFHFADGSWTMIASNTSDDICTDVPADVIKHFHPEYGACR
ncbi:hypothetical protein [Actinoplanes sp. L3-i22]|uniref:hypothetical protein n=1 Tax=Actinoplanes sp. L3-i22 TaxID=2836373 RepID=UPI001C771020|nr:hypothetical protein [Actinoplanes sp. L3-i22]BCY11737.1 hypothetical protein L3i22_068250 [Actinoplanes sp. L3-i22]